MKFLTTTTLAVVSSLITSSQALYFYLDGTTPKCFYEDLPKDTLVVGTYKAEAWNGQTNSFQATPELQMQITVDETFDNDHRVVTQTTTSSDAPTKFTFSAADAGLHRLCFTPSGPAAVSVGSGWFSGGGGPMGGVKLTLDMAIGETSKIESEDKGKIDTIEREAEFRDQSESTNAKIVRWTLIQLAVLGVTCAWQLSHLRSFFIKQKLT
ncbi:emp24p/erv25p- protein [Exophiala dermatitidis]|nr:emp24p/erv25p- protein [Exophiala dermatitidis]KAJ4541773.1 emp24p/erv25p- protein [Exophiala dermatitidis]